jgi:putative hydrolase of the HAD superfamily
MIETAIEVTEGRVPASAIRELIEAGRDLRHGEGPDRAMMVGNSLKSDIVPALEAGCWDVYVPHRLIWALEQDMESTGNRRYRQISHLGELIDIVRGIG